MNSSTLASIETCFRDAFVNLNIVLTKEDLKLRAILVYEAMNHPRRRFHCPEHVLDVIHGQDPLGSLAALYHDVVYESVDDSLPSLWGPLCSELVHRKDRYWFVTEAINEHPEFWMTAHVFGWAAGSHVLVSSKGTSEFLSAMAAVESLRGLLSLKDLLAIVVAIEATIPFRERDHACYLMDHLLEGISESLGLRLSFALRQEMISRGLKLANQDVSNFATEKIEIFLNNNWRLILENHVALQSPEIATLAHLREGIRSMEHFLSHLAVSLIFTDSVKAMNREIFLDNLERARSNIKLGCESLGGWLAAVGVLESLYLEREISAVRLKNLPDLGGLLGRKSAGGHLPMTQANAFEAAWMSHISGLVSYLSEECTDSVLRGLIGLTRRMSFEQVLPKEVLTFLPNAVLERLRALSL